MNKGSLRVLQAMTLFSREPVWGVTQVSKELGCSKNTAFHALDTLLKQGYVVRDASGSKYQIGHSVLKLSRSAADSVDVRSLCRPYLERIHALTGESAFLSILVGRHNVCIDTIRARGVTVGYSPLSQPLPLYAGTGSRLLLAFLSDEEIERYIKQERPFKAFTSTTITDPASLREEVRLVRSRGYATGYEDFSTGATYLSFPVFGPMDRPLAAITVGGPIFRFTEEVASGFIPAIWEIMGDLNRRSRMFAAVPDIRL